MFINNNNSCLSEIEIDNILNYAYLDMRYIDYSIDNFNGVAFLTFNYIKDAKKYAKVYPNSFINVWQI